MPRCLIPCILVIFTCQLGILVTNRAKYAYFAGYLAINLQFFVNWVGAVPCMGPTSTILILADSLGP